MKVMIGGRVLGGHAHLDEGFAVALGVSAAEVTGRPLEEILPLLVADEHHLGFTQVGQAGHDRLVVAQRGRHAAR